MSTNDRVEYTGRQQGLIMCLVVAVILFGVFIRFYALATVPPGLYHDEAYNGLDALKAATTGEFNIVYPGNNVREGLFINIVAVLFIVFGKSLWLLRAVSALFGSLTLVGFYLLERELKLSRLAALAGLFMLSVSFWHLDFSRLAYRASLVPFCLVWAGFFYYRGVNSDKYRHFLAAGLLLGAGLHTYIAFRATPLIFLIVIFHHARTIPGFLKTYWKKLTAFFLAALVAALPLIIYFY